MLNDSTIFHCIQSCVLMIVLLWLLQAYGTTFPIVSVYDMIHSQFLLLDHLGINKVWEIELYNKGQFSFSKS